MEPPSEINQVSVTLTIISGEVVVTPAKDENGNDIEKRSVKEYKYKQIYNYANWLGRSLVDRKLAYKED